MGIKMSVSQEGAMIRILPDENHLDPVFCDRIPFAAAPAA
jgi:hypothetical protein